ncbi:hypothetical protein IP92_04955 [Pseudoduganella flava]|uniref:WGR domain-containing protein n=1 Tax=Pseudoduganella flava TaxID=871742 RepID=A0A562PG18_9BURK|nr:hypothetical protein [Pseudoduganella flava]QGZ40213.1 hypothetical protein GO485_14925 [Pseudoduganella flava]TWI43391.1 hypothetical protein IP92_04955 [Pseudoduganella flava]
MPTQSYRGHVIAVSSHASGAWIVYRSSIREHATGKVRHVDFGRGAATPGASGVRDRAFQDARRWVERHPLRWPFGDGAEDRT